MEVTLLDKLKTLLNDKLGGFQKDEYLIIALVCSLFLHFVIPIVLLIGIVIYLGIKKRLLPIIQEVPRAKFALVFCIITSIVALFYKNYLGALCGVGFTFIFLFIFYYRTIINKRLFYTILELCCILSLISVFWSIFQYIGICNRNNLNVFDFKILNKPENRIFAGFFNANYYAMFLEFVILICVYRMIQIKHLLQSKYYIGIALCNMIALYFTGCRTAWVPFLVTVPFMFLINKCWAYLGLSLSGIVGGIGLVVSQPELFQRMTLGQDMNKRMLIWETAIKGIKAHPLLGEGPLTYYQIYPLYNGHPTQHAHSVYLDPFLSHGIILVLVFAVYLGSNMKQVYYLWKRKIDIQLFSLIGGFILTVLIHGLLDYTIYWVQTALLFLFVISSSSMYFRTNKVD